MAVSKHTSPRGKSALWGLKENDQLYKIWAFFPLHLFKKPEVILDKLPVVLMNLFKIPKIAHQCLW